MLNDVRELAFGRWCFCLCGIIVAVSLLQALDVAVIVVPSSGCYALDNSSHIYDFSSWIGHAFEYEGKQGYADLVVRFCKDVETRSQKEFYNGELANCETTLTKWGVQHRVLVELAIHCEKKGSWVFEGFTVGFHPRSWELVYNGLTRVGFEKSHHDFSFRTEQTRVVLYMTAIASLSHLVQKPIINSYPEDGLEVKLSGSATKGIAPTTLSPAMLVLDWTCEKAHVNPYEVNISIPVEGYESVNFSLTKQCEYRQSKGGDAVGEWAAFGVFSCIFTVLSAMLCCGGFVDKTRVEQLRGLEALPGMSIFSACLDTVSGFIGGHGYPRAEDPNNPFVNHTSWDRPPGPSPAQTSTWKQPERRYGSI